MAYVLFSPIGTTDPVRDCYDGSMLHIVRHYRPKLVRLLISRELWKNEESCKWYSGFVNAVSPETEVSFCDVLEEDPSDFEIFPALFEKEIRELLEEHPEDTVLVNVSSGTTQMKTALTVLASTTLPQVTAVQVRTPELKSNKGKGHDAPGADLSDALAALIDHDPELNAPNRCEELKLENYVARRLRENVRAMINEYAYEAAWDLVRENEIYFSDAAKHAVQGAALRKQFELAMAVTKLREAGLNGILPRGCSGDEAKALEFYLGMKSDLQGGDYARFFVRMSPLAEEMARYTLKKRYGMDVCRYLDIEGKVNDSSFRKDFPDFETYDNKTHSYTLRSDYPSLWLYCRMIKYCAYKQGKPDGSLIERFEDLRKLQVLRNDAAHEMKAIRETDVKQFWKRAGLGTYTQENAIRWFDQLFKGIYSDRGITEDMLKSYELMNGAICALL